MPSVSVEVSGNGPGTDSRDAARDAPCPVGRIFDATAQGPVARRRAFAAIAVGEVATSGLPAADMLFYACGKQWFDGEQRFSIVLAQQFIQRDDAGGDVVRVECEARYRLTPDLLEVATFHQWGAAGELAERRGWLAAIAEHPEWAVLTGWCQSS
jgi:hypothetical protein